MSQDVQTNQSVSDVLADSNPHQPWSADTYADQLMDELFSDIDRVLEGSSKLPSEPVKPEYVALQSLKIPQITLPPAVITSEELVKQQSANPVNASQNPEDKGANRSAKSRGSGWGRWYNKLLLALAVASVGALLILWLAKQQKLNWLGALNPLSSANQTTQLSAGDTQFMTYMLRSLDVIDRKAQASKQQAAVATAQPVNTASNPPALAPTRVPTVLEKVYIPVYPPAQLPYIPQTSLPAPTRPAPKTAARQVSPKPLTPAQKKAQLKPATAAQRNVSPSQAKPATAAQRTVSPPQAKPATPPRVPLPRLQTRPSAALPPLQAPSRVAPLPALQPPPQAEPAPQHTLMGVLELGDRSAALFSINGITQRIRVGESIGASGWTLVTVANQEAIIRRNGEVRSIYVGQKF